MSTFSHFGRPLENMNPIQLSFVQWHGPNTHLWKIRTSYWYFLNKQTVHNLKNWSWMVMGANGTQWTQNDSISPLNLRPKDNMVNKRPAYPSWWSSWAGTAVSITATGASCQLLSQLLCVDMSTGWWLNHWLALQVSNDALHDDILGVLVDGRTDASTQHPHHFTCKKFSFWSFVYLYVFQLAFCLAELLPLCCYINN